MSTLTHPAFTQTSARHRAQNAIGRARLWLQRRRYIAQTRRSLMSLDDIGLRDLGLYRCEIDSVVTELQGAAEVQRRIALGSPQF